MRKKKKKVYKLYAFNVNEQTIEYAKRERFARITPRYILIYKDKEIIEGEVLCPCIIIRESEINHLTEADKSWLFNCNLNIIAEEASKNEDVLLQNLSDTIEKLEKALDEEAKKLSDG